MNLPTEFEHAWFRRHLPDHLLDLLVEDDRERFEKHARACAPCAHLLASALGARGDWWDGAGHPPVSVLLGMAGPARGDRAHQSARAHVASCESCRRDLEDLLGTAAAGEIAVAKGRRGRRAAHFSTGAMAAAAGVIVIAGAALLWTRGAERGALRRWPPAPPSAPAVPAAPADRSPPPAATPAPGRTAEPVTLAAAERGAESTPTAVRIGPGVTRVPLTLPVLFVPDGSPLEVELRDGAGVLISREVLSADRALRPGGVLLPTEDLLEGPYVLIVRWTDSSTRTESREFPLDVRFSR